MPTAFRYQAEQDRTRDRVEMFPDDAVLHPPVGARLLVDGEWWLCVGKEQELTEAEMEGKV